MSAVSATMSATSTTTSATLKSHAKEGAAKMFEAAKVHLTVNAKENAAMASTVATATFTATGKENASAQNWSLDDETFQNRLSVFQHYCFGPVNDQSKFLSAKLALGADPSLKNQTDTLVKVKLKSFTAEKIKISVSDEDLIRTFSFKRSQNSLQKDFDANVLQAIAQFRSDQVEGVTNQALASADVIKF